MSIRNVVPVTWVDVARTLAQTDTVELLPHGVFRARAAWYGLAVEVLPGVAVDSVAAWLEQLFPNRIQTEPFRILLEGPAGHLDVALEELTSPHISRLSFGVIDGVVDFAPPAVTSVARPVPVVACISVKGGTGRTTSAVALAQRWGQLAEKPVLLVDADIEAPGISYMFEGAAGSPKISLEDVVVLAHADESVNAASTVEFAAERLRNHLLSESIYVLPLRRDIDELASSTIKAEHLSTPDRPFALADILASVAHRLGCAGVVVDVRAGLVPLGVNLALDPNVSPVFVSTLSSQSLRATASLTRFIAREVRRGGSTIRKPLLIINRVPGLFRQSGMDDKLIAPLIEEVIAALIDEPSGGLGISDSAQEIEPLALLKIPEMPDLQVMSGEWREYLAQLASSGFSAAASKTLDQWISSELYARGAPDLLGADLAVEDVDARQLRLRNFADQLIAAENVEDEVPKPLVTKPLASLARRFQSEVPIAISEGAKGTGKTMAARYFVSRLSWAAAVFDLVGVQGAISALMVPAAGSVQASTVVQREIDASRVRVAKELGFDQPATNYTTTSYLRDRLVRQLSEREWVETWLDVIAWSCGFHASVPGVGTDFIAALRDSGKHVVATLEGLEELYSSVSDIGVEAAMRAVLVSLPQRLRSETQKPLGIIVFARRDTVEAAIKQNLDQFRREYSPFALTWSEADVLELAAWLATKSGAVPELWSEKFSSIPEDDKKLALEALWGRKLGPDDEPDKRTKEAYSATWIIAVLSDLRGRLVPRDLVRLLATAAAIPAAAEERKALPGRLLVPRSIRGAVEPTSEKKVQETKEEIPELAAILEKFRNKSDEVAAPLTHEALEKLQLSEEDVRTLVKHGIVFGERPPYEVPELFRRGLGLKHAGARRSVVNLYMRARQRYSQSD